MSDLSELEARVVRLERRLERERVARTAAEAIAETSILDLYNSNRHLELIETVAAAANLGDDPAEAFRIALEAVCAFTGWPIGHVLFLDPDAAEEALASSGIWRGADSERFAAFRQASDAMRFVGGVGLPGQVLATAKPVMLEDVNASNNFSRGQHSLACGLRGAFAFPALVGDRTGAVLEFFIDRPAEPDAALSATMERVGLHLGRAVERQWAARRAAAHAQTQALLYDEAERQRDAAQAADRAKTRFLAVTSHEIRTPLNAVLGLSEALRREPLTPGQQNLNDGVLSAGRTLLSLLNAVLDMSKVESGRTEAVLSDFDLPALAGQVTALWSAKAAERDIGLSLYAPDLACRRVRSDPGRIEQTLTNLVSNALKFTPEGGRVELRLACDGREARFEVVDDGPGVDDEDRERIFSPYEQTGLGRDAGGAGLGLAVCAGNTRLLGGDLGCDRDPSGKNRFWFRLPLSLAEPETPRPDLKPEPEPAPEPPERALRVLAAEDNAGNRHVLEALLTPHDIDLEFAVDGEEAVAAAARSAFDIVLMDADMPRLDGVGALRTIRCGGGPAADLPIYMLTANAFDDDVARYMAAGADGVLTKPIDVAALFGVLTLAAEGEARAQAA